MNKREIVCYYTDASRLIGRTEKIVYPKSVKEVQEIVRITMDIVPRGSGSGIVGGTIPKDSTVIDLSKMNKVFNFNPGKMNVSVEAGVSLRELNEKLFTRGLEFPIDPNNEGISSIGGMIASNCSGVRSMKYGSIKDWIDEIEFVNGKGELIKTSKADLGDVCGMEGITGIIVSARIRVIPLINRSASIFQTESIEEALSVARRLRNEKEVSSIQLFSKSLSKMFGFPDKYNLIVEFDSQRGKIRGMDHRDFMKKVNRSYYILASNGYYSMEDPKFFFDRLNEFFSFLESNNIPYIGFLGAGIVHAFFKDNEKRIRDDALNFVRRTQAKLASFGYGLTRKNFLESFEIKLIQRVKERHDPNGKLNKGKVIDEFFSSKIYERKEVKPLAGEEKSVREIFKESEAQRSENQKMFDTERTLLSVSSNSKTPNEKFEDFIKEVEREEKEREVLKELPREIREGVKSPFSQRIKKTEEEEMNERIKDYEQTFDSELGEDRKKIVEDYAKNVPREFIKKEIIGEMVERAKEKPKIDYNQIRNIMTNNKPSDKPGEVKVTDNLERPSKISTSEEKDLINNIMTNRFGKGFGDKNNGGSNNIKEEDKK